MTASKFAKSAPFILEVCNGIRHHVGTKKALESQRVNAFDDRDNAVSEMREMDDHEADEFKALQARHSEAVLLIDDLNTRIKWRTKQIDELVEKGDEPGIDVLFDPTAEQLAKPKKPKDDQLEFGEGETPVKPIGRAGPVKPEVPAPDMGDGVDEHLKASVLELDAPEKAKSLASAAGYTTVGALAKLFEDQASHEVQVILNASENAVRQLHKAVKTFRSEHRKVMVEVEQGG
jgi:hypothetical protein